MKEALLKFKEIQEAKPFTWVAPQVVTSIVNPKITTVEHGEMLVMCANNYMGLAGSKELQEAVKEGVEKWGFGLSGGRSLTGTQQVHKDLELKLAQYLKMEEAMLNLTCFDANGGIFAAMLDEEDAVISDELNHASIIDGIRLCKARRYLYKNNDLADLKAKLEEAKDARVKLIVTDGVFSMDGYIADLKGICDLADEYGALVMVDDSHATGFIGETGRGTHEYCGVMDRVDIITGTFGKALGGALGGFTAASSVIIKYLRARSRPYIFSSSLPPCIAYANIKVLEMLDNPVELLEKSRSNTRYYREKLVALGFNVLEGVHPITPVILGDEDVAREFAKRMRTKGVLVTGLIFPVVPKGKARIRTQVSAAHTKEHLDFAIKCFAEVKAEMGI